MKMKVVLPVLLLAALTRVATALFWRKYIPMDQKMNWTDAQAYCRQNYADLAAFHSQDDQDRYQQYVQSHCDNGCWIGLSRNVLEKTFAQWSEGSNVIFTQWDSNEPTNTMSYNCVYAQGDWHTDDCKNVHSFICYIWKPDLIVVKEMKTWGGALKYCRTKYTDLVSLNTVADLLAVNKKSSDILTPSFWTGLRFLDGSWFWVNQVPINKQRYMQVMPSCPAPGFRCGSKDTNSNTLQNSYCEEPRNFLCYTQSG